MKGDKALGMLLASLIGLVMFGLLWLVTGRAGTPVRRPPSPTLGTSQAEQLIAVSVIQPEDIPGGWRAGGMRPEAVTDAVGRFFWFENVANPELSWVSVSEELIAYANDESANNAYPDWRDQYFPPDAADAWQAISDLEFAHHADEMKIACLPGYINNIAHLACRAVARYQNVVIAMFGNVFDSRWLTMADFRGALEAMDRRIAEALDIK